MGVGKPSGQGTRFGGQGGGQPVRREQDGPRAGLGGLLYGVDVGIIASALPYLEATSGLNAGQLSFIVAAVLLGSVISTLFAG